MELFMAGVRVSNDANRARDDAARTVSLTFRVVFTAGAHAGAHVLG